MKNLLIAALETKKQAFWPVFFSYNPKFLSNLKYSIISKIEFNCI